MQSVDERSDRPNVDERPGLQNVDERSDQRNVDERPDCTMYMECLICRT
jgi:hypothetical protein